MNEEVVDLFGGGGGWDVPAEELGIHPIGVELNDAACRTRYAAGLATWQQDVAAVSDAQIRALSIAGLIASPPCPDLSRAGKGAGIDGDTGKLMWEVPRWVDVARPEWVACEQVPEGLPWWRQFAHEFRALGYSCWTGVLCAADYGVPQTRNRAILIAKRGGVAPPEPTHAEHPAADLFGGQTLPWVSWGETLGVDEWSVIRLRRGAGMIERYGERPDTPSPSPSPSLTAGAHRRMWVLDRRQQHEGVPVPVVSSGRPAPTITATAGKGSQWIFRERQPHGASRQPHQPSMTIPAAADNGNYRFLNGEYVRSLTLEEAAALQSFPPGHPWKGTKEEKFTQVGNAIPCGLARAVLSSVI